MSPLSGLSRGVVAALKPLSVGRVWARSLAMRKLSIDQVDSPVAERGFDLRTSGFRAQQRRARLGSRFKRSLWRSMPESEVRGERAGLAF